MCSYCSGDHRDLHSFPTRRSSDLVNVPEGCIIDAEGKPTTDPKVFYANPPGAILPIAGHKGYGLALICEVLARSEEHTSELQSHSDLVCRLLLEKKKKRTGQAWLE